MKSIKRSAMNSMALMLALSSSHGAVQLPKLLSLPKSKTTYGLDKLAEAEEKRKRKAKKRLLVIKQ